MTLCGNRVTVGVISSSRVAPIQCDWCPNKKEKFGHKQAIRENPLLGSGPPQRSLEGNLRVTERQQNGDPGRVGDGGGRGDQDLKGSGLLSGLTVGACHYTLVQTHRASNPKSDPTVNRGLCVMTMCQSRGHPSGAGGQQRGGCACDGG